MKSIRREILKKKIFMAAGMLLLGAGLTACGSEPEQKYTSPTFNTETVKPGEKYTGDSTEAVSAEPASLSEGDPIDGSQTDVDLTQATLAGTYDGNIYYNSFVGFAITVDGSLWKMYDAAGVAAATGQTEDEVNDLWYGVVSPYSVKNMTCAIAYDSTSGTNLIVSYVTPKLYYMQDMTAREYLELSAGQYEHATVTDYEYLGSTWSCLTVGDGSEETSEEATEDGENPNGENQNGENPDAGNPDGENPDGETPGEGTSKLEGIGRRVQFAIRKDDLIVLLTYTLQGEDTLEDAASHVTRLITK